MLVYQGPKVTFFGENPRKELKTAISLGGKVPYRSNVSI